MGSYFAPIFGIVIPSAARDLQLKPSALKGHGFSRAVNDGRQNVTELLWLDFFNPSHRIVIPSEARDLQLKREKQYFVYIMATRSLNFYTGMCNNIVKRVKDHKEGLIEGFTKRYKINRLVYYEESKYVNNTINREKQIKKWSRAKKIALIRSINPAWRDLSKEWGKPLQIPRSARDGNSVGSQ